MADSDILSQGDINCHPIFRFDPTEWMQYVYKEICVTSADGVTHTGRCYTIDPVSQSVVLAKFDDEALYDLDVVIGHAVASITVLDDDTDAFKERLDRLFKADAASSSQHSSEELREKRERLKSWLQKNFIPVEVSAEDDKLLNVSGVLTVAPPYDASCCQCANEVVLGKVQGLIKSLPTDLYQWQA